MSQHHKHTETQKTAFSSFSYYCLHQFGKRKYLTKRSCCALQTCKRTKTHTKDSMKQREKRTKKRRCIYVKKTEDQDFPSLPVFPYVSHTIPDPNISRESGTLWHRLWWWGNAECTWEWRRRRGNVNYVKKRWERTGMKRERKEEGRVLVVGGIRGNEEKDEKMENSRKERSFIGWCIGNQQLARRHRHGRVWHRRRWICVLMILHSLRRRWLLEVWRSCVRRWGPSH